jgi:hypothetical protein
MQMRTRRFVAHFSTSFRLAGVDGLLPAGAYALDQEEELDLTGFGLGYRCVGMFIHLAVFSSGRWAMQVVPVKPEDLQSAILQKSEHQAGDPIA